MKSHIVLVSLVAVLFAGCSDPPSYSGNQAENNGGDDPLSPFVDCRDDTPEIRTLDRLLPVGFASVNACEDPDGSVRLRFVVLDRDGAAIRPGENLEEGPVNGQSFTEADLSVEDVTIQPVAPSEIVVCARPCQNDVECDLDFSCIEGRCLSDDSEDPDAYCQRAGFDLCTPVDFDNDGLEGFEAMGVCRIACEPGGQCPSGVCIDDGQGGGVCALGGSRRFCEGSEVCAEGFECTPVEGGFNGESFCTKGAGAEVEEASLRFVSPAGCDNTAPRTVAFVMDNSGSLFGRGVSESDRTVRLDRATDPDLFRIAAAKTLLLNMAATTFGESSRTSVWSFRGESPEGVRPLTGSIDGEGSPYVGDVDIVRTAFDQLAVDSDFGRSNVFGALERVAGNMVDLGMAGEPDKTIILFTDGPDDSVTVPIGADADMLEQRRAEHEARLQQAIAAAVASGAQVFVVHLDAGIDVEGLALLRADDRALNLVPRDHEGRTGPLAEYQRIACETGGHYFYATDPFSLTWQFDRIADMLEGAWEVGLSIDGLGEGLSRGAYRLGANLEIGLDGRSEVTSLAPFGVPTSLGQVDTDDNRSVFVRP